MSLTPDLITTFPQSSLVFPAIIDTGCNTGFEIDQKHLVLWTGTSETLFDFLKHHDRSDGRSHVTRKANILLHLEPYTGPRFVGPRMPFHLMRTDQITVMDRSGPEPYPRFPLLGLKAFMDNNLRVLVEGGASEFTIYEG